MSADPCVTDGLRGHERRQWKSWLCAMCSAYRPPALSSVLPAFWHVPEGLSTRLETLVRTPAPGAGQPCPVTHAAHANSPGHHSRGPHTGLTQPLPTLHTAQCPLTLSPGLLLWDMAMPTWTDRLTRREPVPVCCHPNPGPPSGGASPSSLGASRARGSFLTAGWWKSILHSHSCTSPPACQLYLRMSRSGP